jgi:hypothetical protein
MAKGLYREFMPNLLAISSATVHNPRQLLLANHGLDAVTCTMADNMANQLSCEPRCFTLTYENSNNQCPKVSKMSTF